LRLLPRSGTGQKQTAYVSFLNGPRQARRNQAFEFHLILMDNGRTRNPGRRTDARVALLHSLRRVSERLSGLSEDWRQAYGWIYPGPIGAVISPQLQGLGQSGDLPFASSLCGACRTACPVDINLPDLAVGPASQGERIRRRTKVE